MRILIFGASGMVGTGVLRECLNADDVSSVRCIGRTALGGQHGRKLEEIVRPALMDQADAVSDAELSGVDACFFCIGKSSAGMTEAGYTDFTYRFTLEMARRLAALNPAMTLVYVSGAGADSSENGTVMWARVRGRTENALLALPFARVHIFRPGFIRPMYGARSKTGAYRFIYTLLSPLLPILRALAPGYVLTTEVIGRAMLEVARHGATAPVLEAPAINALATPRSVNTYA